jgi:hypothetical protein
LHHQERPAATVRDAYQNNNTTLPPHDAMEYRRSIMGCVMVVVGMATNIPNRTIIIIILLLLLHL